MSLVNKIDFNFIVKLIFFLLVLFSSCYRDLDLPNNPANVPLSSPTGLIIFYAHDGVIYIKWNSSTDNILGYHIYLCNNYEAGNFILEGSTNQTFLLIKNLSYDTTYYIKITEYNSSSESGFSQIVSGRPFNVFAPTAPTGLEVFGSYFENTRQVTLSWYPNPDGDLLKYIIFRSLGVGGISGEYKKIGESKTNAFLDTINLQAGSEYFYLIYAVDKGGLVSQSSSENGDYILEKPILLSPSNLEFVTTTPVFKWQKVTNATSYILVITTTYFGNEILSQIISDEGKTEFEASVSIDNFLIGSNYYWKVFAISKSTVSPNSSSEVRTFYYYPD